MHFKKMHIARAFFVILISVAVVVLTADVPRLILITMDGFRYDYLDKIPATETANFQYFINHGVKADWINNVFPSVTYSSHYTLITGLYPESHGVVANVFYDSSYRAWFDFRSRDDNVNSRWYDTGAEPIYVTNKQGGPARRAGSALWPTGLARVKGIAPDKVIPNADCMNNLSMPLNDRVDYLMAWMTDKERPVNLGLLYLSEPDETGHPHGPESQEVRDQITGPLNTALGYLLQKLRDADLLDTTNIILTSDHGMSTVEHDVNLDKYLDPTWYTTEPDWQTMLYIQIFPHKGYADRIISSLANVPESHVYQKRGEVMRRLHYSNNPRIAPIILEANEGFMFTNNGSASNYTIRGVHGYNPITVKNCRPFFLALGPAFKQGFSAGEFDMVDVYPLMCHLLGVSPAPNNGSLDNVRRILRSGSARGVPGILLIFASACVSLLGR